MTRFEWDKAKRWDADAPAKLGAVTRRRAAYAAAVQARLKRDFLKRGSPTRPGQVVDVRPEDPRRAP